MFTQVTHHFSLRLFSLGWARIRPETWAYPNAESVFWTLYRNEQDGGYIQTGETPLALKAGESYLIPPHCRYRYWCDQETPHFFLFFDILGFSRKVIQELFPGPFHLTVPAPLDVSLANVAIHPESVVDLMTNWQCIAVLNQGLLSFMQSLPLERLEQSHLLLERVTTITPVLQHIENNLATPLSNQELATICHMSKSYFIRQFRQQVMQTPTQYILEARIKMAAQLLLFSDLSLEAIASEIGFGNRYYFTRVFSRQMGVGPAGYRKQRATTQSLLPST